MFDSGGGILLHAADPATNGKPFNHDFIILFVVLVILREEHEMQLVECTFPGIEVRSLVAAGEVHFRERGADDDYRGVSLRRSQVVTC